MPSPHGTNARFAAPVAWLHVLAKGGTGVMHGGALVLDNNKYIAVTCKSCSVPCPGLAVYCIRRRSGAAGFAGPDVHAIAVKCCPSLNIHKEPAADVR